MDKNNILINLSESDKAQFGKEDFATQSVPQQVFSSIWAIESEVNNGGFSQYFLNQSCETAAFVAKALDTIVAPRTADICRRAIAIAFQRVYPRHRRPFLRLRRTFPTRSFNSSTPWITSSFRIPTI